VPALPFGAIRDLLPEKGLSSAENRAREVKLFLLLMVVGLVCVVTFFYNAPEASGDKCDKVTLKWLLINGRDPHVIEQTMDCANAYKSTHEGFLLMGFVVTYVTFQSFAIPGGMCLLLNILAGAIYPIWIAEILVCVCATTGATISFFLSKYLGRGIIELYRLDSVLAGYRQKVNDNRHRLFSWLVVTRCTPVPAVLINIASPLLDVPTMPFVLSTIIGQVPLNSVHMFAGYSMAKSGKFEAGSIKWIMLGGVTVMAYVVCGDFIKKRVRFMFSKSDQKK